jgi:hypothetical protein
VTALATPLSLRSTVLTFRIHRFEMTVVVVATAMSLFVSAAVVTWLTSSGYKECLSEGGSMTFSSVCQSSVGLWMDRIARMSITIVPIFPFVAGLLVGTPLVARELEGGTARLSWSLVPSRLRWFVQRVVPALGLVAVAAFVIGITADALFRALHPTLDLDQSFVGFRGRGVLVSVEALVVASIALAFGSILGRTVPTFVLALILAGAIGVATDKVETETLMNEALISSDFQWTGGDLYLESRFRLADGRIVTWQELYVLRPEIETQGMTEEMGRDVVLYIPGSRYHDIERREALVFVAIAALFTAVAVVAVMRRRPR